MRVVRVGIVWGTGVSFSSIMHFYSFKTLLLSILIPFVGFSYALCPFLAHFAQFGGFELTQGNKRQKARCLLEHICAGCIPVPESEYPMLL